MERVTLITAFAIMSAGCGQGGSKSPADINSSPPIPPAAQPNADVSVESAINAWYGPVISINSAGPKQISISFQPIVGVYEGSDILQANASFSGRGSAQGPTTQQWDLQSVSGQSLNFTVTIHAEEPGPWAVQPQIFIRNSKNYVTFTNIQVRIR